MKLLLGCDPEFVLKNPNSGKFVSAEGIVPGDKLNPHKVKKGTVQVDGFACEIGIEPAKSSEEFADNVETVLEELKKFTGGYEHVYPLDHVVFDKDVFSGQSEKGQELGCDPDFNAYSRLANPTPVPNPKTLRVFAGHIHIGWTEGEDVTSVGHFMDCVSVIKQMDCYIGAPSLAWNRGIVRRSMYGRAGDFRVKPYGVEYRTPDNGWLSSRDRMKMVFDNAVAGMKALYDNKHAYNGWDKICEGGINTGNYEALIRHLQKHGISHEPLKPMKPVKTTVKRAQEMEAAFQRTEQLLRRA